VLVFRSRTLLDKVFRDHKVGNRTQKTPAQEILRHLQPKSKKVQLQHPANQTV